jgi:A/G-specific adenine glycosylase
MAAKSSGGKKGKKFTSTLLDWESKFGRNFPWRQKRNPYKIFISEFLLKRTTSTAAHKFYFQFLEKYPTIFEIERSNSRQLEQIFQPLGLQVQRSHGIKKAAEYIIKNYRGEFPDTFNELIKIPHIGHYSAACILSFGMGISAPAIDSNGIRVLSRVFQKNLGDNPSQKRTLSFAQNILPKGSHVQFNYGLIDFGAIMCSYRGCSGNTCPLIDICEYSKKKKFFDKQL